ncbi:claudin-16 [Alligator mississippiensis]|uniref:claudin-16 n=1 Tax=Alligator mississippiensis TaxID=8496 RepID=UPI002877BFB2|nr:claudin-16 [Alligator mississippiensis]
MYRLLDPAPASARRRAGSLPLNKLVFPFLLQEDAKDPHSSVGLSSRCRGLWSECVFDIVASLRTCDIPTSYLSKHPAVLVTTRALVIVTGVLCVGAMPSLVIGMRCTHLMRSNAHHKYKFTLAAGTLFLLGGKANVLTRSQS